MTRTGNHKTNNSDDIQKMIEINFNMKLEEERISLFLGRCDCLQKQTTWDLKLRTLNFC